MFRYLFVLFLISLVQSVSAEQLGSEGALKSSSAGPLEQSVQQLRDAIGEWNVVTDFLNDDGTSAKRVSGSYEFSWVVADRVVSGKSEIPELQQAAGLLFYVNEGKQVIEMVSVGADGNLWVMTGPLGGETRYTNEYKTADGGSGQLRFTRYNIEKNSFESKMEYTEDGGKTWKPGNYQLFSRAPAPQ